MKIAKSVVAGLVAAAAFALVTACGDDKADTPATTTTGTPAAGASATTAKAVSPAERVTAALAKTGEASHKFSAKVDEGTFSGGADPAAGVSTGKIAIASEGVSISVESRVVSPSEYYVKVTGLPLPGLDGSKWVKIDPKKVTSNNLVSFGETNDPTGLKVVAGNVVTAESADGKQFKGTLDFTRKIWGPVDKELVAALGDKAKALPFEATVDDKGNVTALKVSVPAHADEKAQDVAVTYSDFGVPVKVTAPAASEIMNTPENIYELLNSE